MIGLDFHIKEEPIMLQVNAIGDACPIPVVKTKQAIASLNGPGQVEVLVDNEIAVQNLTKMANQKGYAVASRKEGEGRFAVTLTVGEGASAPEAEETVCRPDSRSGDLVVAVTSDAMGSGDDQLGRTLLKGFIYALTQQDTLPQTILFYNGGAKMTCEGSPALEDLRSLEAQGVRILTCGTCLNFYGLTDQLQVGSVTNMYDIVEILTRAGLVLRP
jgi:selenium metabolism protein YedF